MKKILSLLAAALLTGTAIQAQEPTDSIAILKNQIDSIQTEKDNLSKAQKWNSIWSNNKYTMISYAPSTDVTVDGAYKEDAKFSFALTKGNTYYLHSKPIGGILKIGLDVRWFDIQATKYEKIEYETSDNWQDSPSFGNEDEDADDVLEMLDDIGRWDLQAGIGIGPAVTVAPFSMFDNASKHIRFSFYGHYQPSFGINLISQDGDVESSTAFCNMFNYGGKLIYRRISFGIEKQWGEGKYKQLNIFNDDEDNSDLPSVKHKRKFSSLRLYVAFSF